MTNCQTSGNKWNIHWKPSTLYGYDHCEIKYCLVMLQAQSDKESKLMEQWQMRDHSSDDTCWK